jgi:hypothetical protein
VPFVSSQVSITIANGLQSADATIIHSRQGGMTLAPRKPYGMVALGLDGLLEHGPQVPISDQAPGFPLSE